MGLESTCLDDEIAKTAANGEMSLFWGDLDPLLNNVLLAKSNA